MSRSRVKEQSTTTGTGSLTLAGTVSRFITFANSEQNVQGLRLYYVIEHQSASEYEIGIGTITGSTTLVRSKVLQSSNSNALVNFSAGTKDVYISLPGGVDNLGPPYSTTLASGVLVKNAAFHKITPQSGNIDQLSEILAGVPGDRLVLRAEDKVIELASDANIRTPGGVPIAIPVWGSLELHCTAGGYWEVVGCYEADNFHNFTYLHKIALDIDTGGVVWFADGANLGAATYTISHLSGAYLIDENSNSSWGINDGSDVYTVIVYNDGLAEIDGPEGSALQNTPEAVWRDVFDTDRDIVITHTGGKIGMMLVVSSNRYKNAIAAMKEHRPIFTLASGDFSTTTTTTSTTPNPSFS
jgi:hypothetical protein